jgi:hypothetical protein
MDRVRAVVVVFLLLFPTFRALSQGNIQVHASSVPVNTLSIADIDFLNATTPKLLFSVDITNTSGRELPVVMVVRIDALLTAENLSYDGALTMTTRAFLLGPALTVTNLDIGLGKIVRDSLYEKDQAAIDKIKSIALSSGSLPAGTYHFTVTVQELQSASRGTGDFSLVLTNPTSVDLLFPLDGDPGSSSLPVFQWLFDGYRSRLKVFEKLPWMSSLEEAASGVPHLVAETSTRSYAYPSSGVRTLEPGKTYVWLVEGLVAVSGGSDVVLRSPLRSFTVASTGQSMVQSFLDDLERTLDPKYKYIFDELRSDGMTMSGTIRIDGTPIPMSELLRLLSRFRSHPQGVENVIIEE